MSAYTLDPAAALKSAKRGSAKVAALYVIDGQYVTAAQVAERMGTDKRGAAKRIARVKAKPGPLTWVKLGVNE
jgi:hypothetical protein